MSEQEVVEFLEREGAARVPHAAGRSLLDHLKETAAIASRWGAASSVVEAALIHSVYGRVSDPGGRPRRGLLPLSRRADVAAVAGERAERLAWLFVATPRQPLLAGTLLWVPAPEGPAAVSREELEALILLHAANLADQARAADGGPGRWVARVGELAALLPAVPRALEPLRSVDEDDEELGLALYAAGDERSLAMCAATLPVVGEPCLWLAWLAAVEGRSEEARRWARLGGARLVALGVAWDKRLGFAEWLEVAGELSGGSAPAVEIEVGDAEGLLAVLRGPERAGVHRGREPAVAHRGRSLEGRGADGRRSGAPRADGRRSGAPRADGRRSGAPRADGRRSGARRSDGRDRFRRYVESLDGGDSLGREYPGLEGGPWFDPSSFALARWLEAEFDAVRTEIEGLDAISFQREAERIPRSGDWDVAFLWERGRRRHEVCEALPLTAAAIERLGGLTTMTGLAYVSRMRPGTAIAPHRGPTNLRVRLHLGVVVPRGDCGLRVAGSARGWETGRCLVFDDFAEHEAWNRTAGDRIVLIVDLWHPGLSAVEVELLRALHGYAFGHAVRLGRYWSANAAAAAAARRAGDD